MCGRHRPTWRNEALAAGIDNQFHPAIDGLAHIVGGGTFTALGAAPSGTGRRLLGSSVGKHWYLAERSPNRVGLG
jgi:hypothetical protein